MPTKRKYEDFFYYEEGEMARCKRGGCSRPVVRRTQTTSLEKHIKKHHPDDYSKFMTIKKGGAPSENYPKDDGNAAVEDAGTSKDGGTAAEENAGTSKDLDTIAGIEELAQAPRTYVDRAVCVNVSGTFLIKWT